MGESIYSEDKEHAVHQSHQTSHPAAADARRRRRAPAARIRLRRPEGVRPVPALRRFSQRQPRRIPRRLSLASSPRHRNHHLRARRRRRTRRQPRQPRNAVGRRRAVDDGGQRHHAPGNAEGRCAGPHARVSALGKSPLVAQDDRAPVSGHPGQGRSRRDGRRRDERPDRVRKLLGHERTGRRHRRRSDLHRRLRAAGQTQDAAGRNNTPRVRVRLCRIRHVPEWVRSTAGENRQRHGRAPPARETT